MTQVMSGSTQTCWHFSGYNAYKEPIDHFELMAMVAPRALLQTGDSEYYWLGDRSATYDSLATEKIYANYGIGDRFGYYIDTTHTHCAVPAYQQNATQPVINRFLFGTNATPVPQVSWLLADALQPGAQPKIDPDRWTAWWGTGKPAFPAARCLEPWRRRRVAIEPESHHQYRRHHFDTISSDDARRPRGRDSHGPDRVYGG